MHWFYYVLLSIPVAGLGLLGGGWVGDRCVRWYRISSFEGGSGYFMIGLALLGGVVGLVTGLVAAGLLGPQGAPAYLRTFGVAAGSLVGLTGVTLLLCRLGATIPPELDGRPLVLEVEVRLPIGVAQPTSAKPEDVSLQLNALGGDRLRFESTGTLRLEGTRQEGGRWIVPGEVPIETRSRRRVVEFRLPGMEPMGFSIALPGRPGRALLDWSGWLPNPPAPHPAWPDSKPSYRFRIQKVPEPPPAPTEAEVAEQREAEEAADFAAVKPDAPLTAWFPYVAMGVPEPRRAAAVTAMTAKPGFEQELAELMQDDDAEVAAQALRLVELLPPAPEERIDAVAAVGRALVEQLRRVVAVPAEADPSYDGAAEISVRFSAWMCSVRAMRKEAKGDFVPELTSLLELARTRPDSHCLRQDVCRVASYYLKEWAGIEPLPSDPPPR